MQSKSSRIAVIDIGTNTCILLVAEKIDGKIIKLYESTEFPRLGEGVDESKEISFQALQRLIKTLKEFSNIARSYEADRIYAFATSALRDASNKKYIISQVASKTDITIKLIDGITEAKFGFYGALYDFEGAEETEQFTVLDIGGGSTENSFINDALFLCKSIDVGSVRIKEKFFKDGINDVTLTNAKEFINNKFLEINFLNIEDKKLVGIAGTVTSLSALNQGLKVFDETNVHKSILSVNDVDILFNRLSRLTDEEILNLGSYMKGRNDIITSGALILLEFMKYFNFDEIIVSTKGVRYGVFLFLSK